MKKSAVPARLRLIATLLCAALLAYLFVFPHRRLSAMCEGIEALAADTVEAVITEAWDRATENFDAMRALYAHDRTFLHLLLSHAYVEELEAALNGGARLIEVRDQPQTLLVLETIIARVRYLKAIEDPRLLTLI